MSSTMASTNSTKPQDTTPWTLVTRSAKRSGKSNGRIRIDNSSAETSHAPGAPVAPDDGVTLPGLRAQYARMQQRWREDIERGRGAAAEFAAAIQAVPAAHPVGSAEANGDSDASAWCLDTVVCVALGTLSSDRSPRLHNRGDKGRRILFALDDRTTAMAQLVALESWIACLRSKGHALPEATSLKGSDDDVTDESQESKEENGPVHAESKGAPTDFDESPDPNPASTRQRHSADGTALASTPISPHGLPASRKFIQDPVFNSLDVAFLTELGWTVLPFTHSTQDTGSNGSKSPSAADAANYITPSTLVYAPHAPHPLVERLLLGTKDSAVAAKPGPKTPSSSPAHVLPKTGQSRLRAPGVYIGNEPIVTTDSSSDEASGTIIEDLQRWLALRHVRWPREVWDGRAQTAFWSTGVFCIRRGECGSESESESGDGTDSQKSRAKDRDADA